MRFVITCRDGADAASVRQYVLPAHRTYVDDHRQHLLVSGPLLDENGSSCGQLFVVEFPDRHAALRFVEEDPLTRASVFASVSVDAFRVVFWNGERGTIRDVGDDAR